jgi:hypothetical protein
VSKDNLDSKKRRKYISIDNRTIAEVKKNTARESLQAGFLKKKEARSKKSGINI